ncbi:hypothetical protein [Algoriphagus sp. PAP.12]|uniref:hypothetical protein n=1 Tax=Algoriphagus sp. PAP.12 TaxID=2996678 RepID=UPI00227B873F|nr:hypothetical protein [Algoriphagus sp. PAP.12]
MELTKSHLDQIKSIANSNDIYYRDIRNEWIDHIASQIENVEDDGKHFNEILEEKIEGLLPRKFQRQILLNIHWGVMRDFFFSLFHLKNLIISLVITLVIGGFLSLFISSVQDLPFQALKTTFLIAAYGTVIFGFWKSKTRRNAQVLATVNSIFFLASMSVWVFHQDFLQLIGISPKIALYALTFYFMVFLVSAFQMLFKKIQRLRLT